MNIDLPPPPKTDAPKADWSRWIERLWRYVRPEVARSGDENAAISSATTIHVIEAAVTAPRTLTLPPVSSLRDGDSFWVIDQGGGAGANPVTITGPVNGGASVTLNTARAARFFVKIGSEYFSRQV